MADVLLTNQTTMTDQISGKEQRKNTELKNIQPGLWTRFWAAYRAKIHSDQTFHATMIAIQVAVVVLFVVGVIVFVVQESKMNSLGLSFMDTLTK